MKKVGLAIVASASLLAVPVFAATTNGSSNGMSSSSSSSSETGSNGQQQSPQQQMAARQKLVKSLKSDGFTDVHVVADSFLVHAMNKEGQPVVMIINPDSVFSETLVKNPHSQSAKSESGNGSSLSNGTVKQ